MLNQQQLEKRLSTLQWAIPLFLALLVLGYQLGVARWVLNNINEDLHFSIEVLFFSTSGPLLAFWTLRQIKRWLLEKTEALEQARSHRNRLAAITNASADAILGITPSGEIDSWNDGAELLFGYLVDEIVGQPLDALFRQGDAGKHEADWLLNETGKQGFIRGHETVCLAVDASPRDVEITGTKIPGQLQGFSLIMRDITQRKQREQEIQKLNARLNQQVEERTHQLAEKMEQLAQANQELQKLDQMRSEFVSVVSHQIRAPLTNVQGAVERMQKDCLSLSPTCGRMFHIVEHQIDRLDRLVRDVLNTTRIESGELSLALEPISLQPVIQGCIREISSRLSSRKFYFTEKPGIPLVYGDRDRIAEVILNILDNADKYSPHNARVEVSLQADESEVIVSIRDYGPGIPEDKIPHLFEKFYRTDYSDSQNAYGYGLGLYICKLLIEAQQGRIWAENNLNAGAVFSFSLPTWRETYA